MELEARVLNLSLAGASGSHQHVQPNFRPGSAELLSCSAHWETASILMFNAFLPCQAHELSLAQTHILASTAQRTVQATKIPGSHAKVH